MEEFVKEGKKFFGLPLFTDMKYQVDSVRLGSALMIYGYDDKAVPHIFTVDDDAGYENHDLYGFWTIGSGASVAISSLTFGQQGITNGENETFYQVITAKFMAESVGGVGKSTHVLLIREDGNARVFTTSILAAIKDMWKNFGMPRVPDGAIDAVRRQIEEVKEFVAFNP